MVIKVLGVEFENSITLNEVIRELKKQGLSVETIPYHFFKAQEKQKEDFVFNQNFLRKFKRYIIKTVIWGIWFYFSKVPKKGSLEITWV
jgi:hypothetical protein